MDEAVAARALLESEEFHRITLINMSDAVFITNDEGVFTFVCPNADVIFGYGQDEVRAMGRISALLGGDLIELEQLATSGEVRNIERDIQTKGGALRSLLVHVKAVSIRGGTILYVCRDVTERKQAEQNLRRNEARLKLALEAAGAGTWDWQVPSGEMDWSPETHRMFGDTAGDRPPSFESFLDRVHPLDRERVAWTMSDAVDRAASYETEFRLRGYDDVDRWVMGKGRAIRNGRLRMLGVFVDVTQRHQVEEALRDLGGRLINAHEQERIRLSRELHDDLGQRLSLLSAEIAILRNQLAGAPPLLEQVAELSHHIQDIGSTLHRLSHELHPAWLEQLGLSASIRRLCEDVARVHHIAMHLEIAEVQSEISRDVALCLYRIAQEALGNVVKHSGAGRTIVSLKDAEGAVALSVIDDGVGFEPAALSHVDGLGLISMRERARLVRAHMSLTSKPGQGTRLDVRVPLASVSGE